VKCVSIYLLRVFDNGLSPVKRVINVIQFLKGVILSTLPILL
jgi:hypothetical protein